MTQAAPSDIRTKLHLIDFNTLIDFKMKIEQDINTLRVWLPASEPQLMDIGMVGGLSGIVFKFKGKDKGKGKD